MEPPPSLSSSPIKCMRKIPNEATKLPMMTRQGSFSDSTLTRQSSSRIDSDKTSRQAIRANRTHNFTEVQIFKYRAWFDTIDVNSSGAVDIKELSTLLIGAGVVKNKREARVIFDEIDTNRNGTISFQEFVAAIAESEAKQRIQIRKLDNFIDRDSLLGPETLLSMQRRHVIMDHIIRKNELRASDIDWAQAMSSVNDAEQARENRKQLSHVHAQERAATNRILQEIKEKIFELKAANDRRDDEIARDVLRKSKRRSSVQKYCPDVSGRIVSAIPLVEGQVLSDDTPIFLPSQMVLSRLRSGEDSASSSAVASRCCSDDESSVGSSVEDGHLYFDFHVPLAESGSGGSGVVKSDSTVRLVSMGTGTHHTQLPVRKTIGNCEGVVRTSGASDTVSYGSSHPSPVRVTRSLSDRPRVVLKRIGCFAYHGQEPDTSREHDQGELDEEQVENGASSAVHPVVNEMPKVMCNHRQLQRQSNSHVHRQSFAKGRKDLHSVAMHSPIHSPIQFAREYPDMSSSPSSFSSPCGGGALLQDSPLPMIGSPVAPITSAIAGESSVAGRPLTTVRKKRFGAAVTGRPLL